MSPTAGVAIVGIGATVQGELPGLSSNEIAVQAARAALDDAGMDRGDIDGLVTCMPLHELAGTDEQIGGLLGLNPRYSSTLQYGAAGFSLHLASMAIASGLATTVLLTYGTNQRSSRTSFGRAVGGAAKWASLAGLVHVAGPAAMAARRHMELYGTTEEQLGWVSVAQREWAALNDRAIFREPLTIQQYLDAPYVVEPLRRADLTMISDGGVAVIVTAADRAGDHPHPPVHIAGMAQRSSLRGEQTPDNLMRPWIRDIADAAYRSAGLGAADIDVAYLQDATSVWVLQMLEWYGFCGVGEAGPFLADGHTRPGGSLPVNTNGGQLSESYMWNWLHLFEAVQQLRGEAGPRQVPDARVALHAQTHDFWKGAATILVGGDAR